MSKSVREVRRELFEADFKVRRKSTFPAIELSRDSGGGYKYNSAHSDWMAWNAALDAVEIQLPEPHSTNGGDCVVDYDDCRAAIEQTWLGLRAL